MNLNFISSIEVEYANGISAKYGAQTSIIHRCEMDDGEYITSVEVYTGDWFPFLPVVFDVKFITKTRVCGNYSPNRTASQLITGHQLLYISGRGGEVIDSLTMNFDYNCSMP